MVSHQYVQRYRGYAADERLLADRIVSFLYSARREAPSYLQAAFASGVATDVLAHWQFDRRLSNPQRQIEALAHRLMIRESESVTRFSEMKSFRELFERKIRYWDVRPLPASQNTIVAPADGKLLPFAAFDRDWLPVKSKFIRVGELLGGFDPWRDECIFSPHAQGVVSNKTLARVSGVIVRLTPDVYHYTHAPVAGRVVFHQTIDGAFHSCNPSALVKLPGSYAINRRTVTVYDTDVEGGTGVGRVAQIDVAAMMIGCMQSMFSTRHYDAPQPLRVGSFVPRGAPVSLFQPGSSTSIVLWDGQRSTICEELIANSRRTDLRSRFSDWLGQPWVETQVAVRQSISESVS